MPRLPLATPGTFTDQNGTAVAFTEGDLAASAQAYDPAKHEAPVVIGHPTHTAPAYGWIKELSFGEGGLVAEAHNTVVEFAELVTGPFKKRSARFYTPNSPRNPVPGVYYLRDVGLLGAQPPAIKGLRDVAFAEEADGDVVEVAFAETSDWTLAKVFRGLRDYIIETAGVEKADSIIPDWAVEEAWMASMQPMAEADVMFAEQDSPNREHEGELDASGGGETAAPPSDSPTIPPTEQADPMTAELESREKTIADREAALAAREAEMAKAEHIAFAETVKAKVHPSQQGAVVDLLCHLDGRYVTEVEFAEGETPLERFKALLNALPPLVEFGELPGATDTVSFAEDPIAHAQAITAYQAEQAAKGITIGPSEAAIALSKK